MSVALRVTFFAPVSAAPSSMDAVVVSKTMLRAAPAPIPTVPASLSFAIALSVLETDEAADRVTSLEFMFGGARAPFDLSSAFVVTLAMVSANEPAMPTLPLPAPEVASASKLCFVSPALLRIAAARVRPCELTVASVPTTAAFVTVASVMATAAPMFSELASTAEPLPFAVPSVFAEVERVTRPPLVTVRPSAIWASDCEVIIVIAAAAATSTELPPLPLLSSPLFAAGVFVFPESLPLAPEDVLLASERFESALPFTSLPEVSSPLPLAPFALAVASLSVDEEPSAVKLTAPVAARFRSSCESTRWFATVSASERPMPALPPFVAPVAVVVTFAVCVACAVTAPPTLRSGPVPIVALVVTFESEMATWAERAMLPLPAEAPPSAVVVVVSVSFEVSVRLFAPVSVAPLARPALVVSLMTFRAKEAPTPDVLPSLACFASAMALFVWFVREVSETSPLTVTGLVVPAFDVVFEVTTLTAIEPATPTLLPPAPDVACAVKVELPAVTVAVSFGVPVQPVIPKKWVASVLV